MNGMAILESPEFQQALNHLLAEQVTRIRLRSDISANWTEANPMLHNAEFGVETDTGHMKVGDDATNWNGLDYIGSAVYGTVATATSDGKRGMVKFNATHLFVCVATNTWRRVALSTW